MSRALSIEDAVLHKTLLCRTVPLETFLINRGILSMVVWMHLHVAGADVSFITFILYAMVVSLLAIVLAIAKLDGAVVGRCEAKESVV